MQMMIVQRQMESSAVATLVHFECPLRYVGVADWWAAMIQIGGGGEVEEAGGSETVRNSVMTGPYSPRLNHICVG